MWPTPVDNRIAEQAVLKTPSVSNAWQLGTILKALALSDSVNGTVRLQIGARVVTAQTSLPLRSGEALRLQVAETGRTVVLKSVGDQPQADPIRSGIRQNLPRQMLQTPLLAGVLNLAKTSTEIPAALTVAVTRLVSTMRNAGSLTETQGLRMAVRDSGNFLENRLATALNTTDRSQATALPRDWKAALLRFREQLTQLQVRLAGDAGVKQPARPLAPGSTANGVTVSVGVTRGGAAAGATAGASVAGVQTSGAAGALPTIPAAAQAISTAGVLPTSPNPNHVTVTGSSVTNLQSADVVVQSGPNARQPTLANNAAPPMRHALPQPQPIVQHGNLPTDALSLVGELISNSDGALARIRLNQLASITPDHGSRLVWLLELPVRHADDRAEVVTMRIEKDEEGGGAQEEPAWTADLAFDLGTKGELRARVALRAGRVSVSFWADADRTSTEVKGKLPLLKTAMEKKQLDVATLTAATGRPTEAPAPPASLLETKA